MKLILLMVALLVVGCIKEKSKDTTINLAALQNFTNNGNGTVVDSQGRMWMMCTYGQVWDPVTNTCTGTGGGTTFGAKSVAACGVAGFCFDTATLLLNSGPAYSACEEMDFAGFSDWRLPTRTELVELALLSGNRNSFLLVFPNSPDDKLYWTASISESDNKFAYAVNFAETDFGKEFTRNTTSVQYVRCVRP